MLVEAGEQFGLQPAGMHALNSLRIEKAYRHWGHDITEEDTPLDAGLGFAVDYDKIGGFRGREALLKARELPRRRRLLQFRLTDPKPLLYHEEPIWRDGQLVGRTTSGMYGHTLGGSVAHSDPCGRLSGGPGRNRRHGGDRSARDRRRGFLRRHVRDSSRGRRDHHVGAFFPYPSGPHTPSSRIRPPSMPLPVSWW